MWITTPYNTLNLKHIVSIEITEITNIIDDAHTHAVDAEYAHREGTATLFTGTLAECKRVKHTLDIALGDEQLISLYRFFPEPEDIISV